jgi:hypothetical protein
MFGLQTLDIAIGLIFIYFVLSIICTAANEIIAGLFQLRANNLIQGIENLLKDQGIADLEKGFYKHPLIKSLYKKDKKPSYIPSRTFALALLDQIIPAKTEASRYISDVRAAVSKMDAESGIRRNFLIFLDEAENDMQKFQKSIETWFNDAMDRVSGWYKRKVQIIVFVLGAFIVALSNADTIQIVKTLSNDPALRQEFGQQVQEFVKQQSAPTPTQSPQVTKEGQPAAPAKEPPSPGKTAAKEAVGGQLIFQEGWKKLQEMEAFGIPMGWKTFPDDFKDWFTKLIGLLLTALAVSLGAPFWFDLLNKVVSIRSVGVSPEEKALKLEKEGTAK